MNDLTLQKARAYEAEHGAAISPAERPRSEEHTSELQSR